MLSSSDLLPCYFALFLMSIVTSTMKLFSPVSCDPLCQYPVSLAHFLSAWDLHSLTLKWSSSALSLLTPHAFHALMSISSPQVPLLPCFPNLHLQPKPVPFWPLPQNRKCGVGTWLSWNSSRWLTVLLLSLPSSHLSPRALHVRIKCCTTCPSLILRCMSFLFLWTAFSP